ncbi:MAG TPA: leishmanolysin-related zinc metalloendopeptidase [Gemmatimonadales bacterium]|nr:leishmanolysin-related zinc metalloendopeptidase [Gemmatimonadales bacterium]
MLLRRTIPFALALGAFACSGTEPFVPVPTAIHVLPGTVSFGAIGGARALTAVVLDQRGDTIRSPSVQWSVGAGSVASVDQTGHVSAVGLGTTKVFASAQGSATPIKDSVTVSVAQIPAQLVKVAGDQQVDTTSGALPTAVVVQVNDSFAHPIEGVAVGFAVTQGGGSVTPGTATTDVQGQAAVVWTLGSAAGPNALTATVTGTGITGNPASFGATAVAAGSMPSVAVLAGDGQTGLAGFAVNFPPAVVVRDGNGAPLAGAAVSFAVTDGGGTVQGGAAVTNASGVAQVGSWTVTLGANALTATVQGGGSFIGNPVTFTATGAAAAYHIDVRFPVATTPARQAVFAAAASKWESLIFGDVPDVPLNVSANRCISGQPAIHETVDDIIIYAILDSIDGPGKILGQSFPCLVRQGTLLPVVGVMEFDTADVASLEGSGLFGLVIEHEMGHVLGFGTIWGGLNLLAGAGTSDSHFTGPQALAAFDRVGGLTFTSGSKVPVENCVGIPSCGQGTQDSHWRELVFKNELMTGFVNSGANPLSVVTTASMGDLGYLVNYAASDSYSVPAAAAAPAAPGTMLNLGDDILRMPILVVNRAGTVVQTISPR